MAHSPAAGFPNPMGGMGGSINLQQIGGALGIFAVLDKYVGGNPYLSAMLGILIATALTSLYPSLSFIIAFVVTCAHTIIDFLHFLHFLAFSSFSLFFYHFSFMIV